MLVSEWKQIPSALSQHLVESLLRKKKIEDKGRDKLFINANAFEINAQQTHMGVVFRCSHTSSHIAQRIRKTWKGNVLFFFLLAGQSRQQNGMNSAVHGLLALLIIPSVAILVLTIQMVRWYLYIYIYVCKPPCLPATVALPCVTIVRKPWRRSMRFLSFLHWQRYASRTPMSQWGQLWLKLLAIHQSYLNLQALGRRGRCGARMREVESHDGAEESRNEPHSGAAQEVPASSSASEQDRCVSCNKFLSVYQFVNKT